MLVAQLAEHKTRLLYTYPSYFFGFSGEFFPQDHYSPCRGTKARPLGPRATRDKQPKAWTSASKPVLRYGRFCESTHDRAFKTFHRQIRRLAEEKWFGSDHIGYQPLQKPQG